MKVLSFKRGIHPRYSKDATKSKAIERLMPNEELVFPMQQHIGAPCKPIVKKGDRVLVGQKIGEAESFVCAPIHSSVSGVVKSVEPHMTHLGTKIMSVVVTNDGLYEETQELSLGEERNYKKLSREEIIEIVKEAGLVGMGGATFPTHIKLNPPKDKNIDTIIINGAECEPYLTSDHRVMLEEGERIIEGIRILLHMFPKAKAYVGIEDNKLDAIENLKKFSQEDADIEICALATKYPQGSEKHLISAITQKEVPSGGLPADIGCIVQNIDTMVAIWRAVTKGRPIMRRIVTVSGNGVKNPCNLKVRIGTSYRELLEYAGWDSEKTVKIISGGPMMGIALSSIDVPVVKGTSAILCFIKDEVADSEMQNCIRCGKCVSVCPVSLIPNTLHRMALNHKIDDFLSGNGMDCIECGSCSYICPSKRHLVQTIRTAKAEARARKSQR